jgi:hypothetical protein
MSKKLSVAIQILLALTALAGSVYVALTPPNSLINWYNSDDGFFYYRVAANFWGGLGFSFDGINLTNGFHPLWMVVCLSIFWLAKFSVILPLRVLVVVSGLFNAATALVLYRFLKRYLHPAAATVASFFWALMPSIYSLVTVRGMESGISAFFLVLLISGAAKLITDPEKITFKKMVWLGVIGALTILARLDNVFVVAVIGFFLMLKVTRIPRVLIYDLVIISIGMMTAWVLRFGLAEMRFNTFSIYPTLGMAILIKPAVFYFCGLYKGFNDRKAWQRILLQLLAAVINFGAVLGLEVLLYRLGILTMLSYTLIVYDAIVCSIMIFCSRLIHKKTGSVVPSPFTEFKRWFRANWKAAFLRGSGFAVPIAIVGSIYITLNKLIFGTFAPISGKVKVWWGSLPNTAYAKTNSLLMLLGLDPDNSDSSWALATKLLDKIAKALTTFINNNTSTVHSVIFLGLCLIVVFSILAILNSRSASGGRKAFAMMVPALFIGCLFQIAYYNTVGYQGIRDWYWVAELEVTVLVIALLLDVLFIWLDEFKPQPIWAITVAILAVAILGVQHVNYVVTHYPLKVTPGRETAYLTEIRELEQRTAPNSKIGMTGGGQASYFIQGRTIVNLDGLINSVDYFKAMQSGTAQAFLDALPLNYVYGNSYILQSSNPYRDILSGRLIEIGVIKGYDNFVLYKYEPNQ